MYKKMKELFDRIPRSIRIIVIALFIAIFAIMLIWVISNFVNIVSTKNAMMEKYNEMAANRAQKPMYNNFMSNEEFGQVEKVEKTFSVKFLNVGRADCTVVTNGDETMLVDTGDSGDGTFIVQDLMEMGVNSISVLVCTNEKAEHVGGLQTILQQVRIDTMVVPNVNTENEYMRNCIASAKKRGTTVISAKSNDAWNIGETQVMILSANENVIIRFTILQTAFLLMSDATAEEEKALLSLDLDITANILKASDHGSVNTSCEAFLKEVDPDYAIVSCDENIVKPNIKTMNRLYKYSVVYRNDHYDSILVECDGNKYSVDSLI